MSDRFDIPARETDVVRLFLIDIEDEALRNEFLEDPAFAEAEGRLWGPIEALQATRDGAPFTGMNRAYIDVVDPEDLDELGLSGLLTEGFGISEAEVAPLRARLDGIREHVLIVGSQAFDGLAVSLQPRAPLRWIATLRQEPPRGTMEALHAASAQGQASVGGMAEPVSPALPTFLKVIIALMLAAIVAAIALGLSGAGR